MAEKKEIRDVRTCDLLIASFTKRHLEAMREEIRVKRKLHRFIQFADKYERELNDIGLQLELIAENLVHLPEGILRDEHLRRQQALELRRRILLARMPDYSAEHRVTLTKEYEGLKRWVSVLVENMEEIKKRKEELIAMQAKN